MKHLIPLIFLVSLLHAQGAELSLTWTDNSDNETGFIVERAPGTSTTFAEVGRTGANVTAYKDLNLPKGTQFTYRIRSFNSVGISAPSETATGTTANSIPGVPGKPIVIAIPLAKLVDRFEEQIAIVKNEIDRRRGNAP